MLAACTIVSPNYLPFARTLAASLRLHHPHAPFFVLLVADVPPDFTLPTPEPFPVVPVSAIGIPNLRVEAMKYDILELNTNVKPAFLQYLFATYPDILDLVYLDPDIEVYSPLTPVTDLLQGGASAVLTPHITSPITDDKHPSEQDLLYNGTYNLGFIALRRSAEADEILAWWNRRCLDLGFSEGRTGLFVDQKWINLLPGLFPGVAILRDPGCNMAYWNLHERSLIPGENTPYPLVKSPKTPLVPLCFFHFSGIIAGDATVLSRNTDRFTLASRPDLQALFAAYLKRLQAHSVPANDSVPYGFDRLSDGSRITRLARRLFAANLPHFAPDRSLNPFDATSSFARFARRERLLGAKTAVTPGKSWRDFNPSDRRVTAVHLVLHQALRLLGPDRYELLMRYLAHISVVRHQGAFLTPNPADLSTIVRPTTAASTDPTLVQPAAPR